MDTLKSDIDKARAEIDRRAKVMVAKKGIEIDGIFYPLEEKVYNLLVDAIKSNQILVDKIKQYRAYIANECAKS